MQVHVFELIKYVDVDIWARVLFYNLHNAHHMCKVNISEIPIGIIAINHKYLGALRNTSVWKQNVLP